MSPVIFDIITIFPAFFQGPLSHGMVHQAELRDQLRKARTADAVHALLVQDAARPAA